jgi:hypothetical protein
MSHTYGPDDKQKRKSYWRRAMESTHRKLSRGAEYISNMMSKPFGDGWRRKDKKK